jgi:hypothetical protein
MSHDLDSLLGGIPREPAPEIPLESLLDRASAGRRRVLALSGVGLAALLLLAVSLSDSAPEPPVHLNLRVINVEPQEDENAQDQPLDQPLDQPGEFDRP